jgi:hypothetical protein
MVQRESRRRLAELLRGLVAGRITNDEFELAIPRDSGDSAVREVFRDGAWFLYDDLHEHRLVGKYRLSRDGRDEVARWVLFLESDLEYEWPVPPMWKRVAFMLASVGTLGLLAAIMRRRNSRNGALAVWPFRTLSAYEAALRHPPYLNGAG